MISVSEKKRLLTSRETRNSSHVVSMPICSSSRTAHRKISAFPLRCCLRTPMLSSLPFPSSQRNYANALPTLFTVPCAPERRSAWPKWPPVLGWCRFRKRGARGGRKQYWPGLYLALLSFLGTMGLDGPTLVLRPVIIRTIQFSRKFTITADA